MPVSFEFHSRLLHANLLSGFFEYVLMRIKEIEVELLKFPPKDLNRQELRLLIESVIKRLEPSLADLVQHSLLQADV